MPAYGMQAVAKPKTAPPLMKSLTKSIPNPQCSFANVVAVPAPLLAAVLGDVKGAFSGSASRPARKYSPR